MTLYLAFERYTVTEGITPLTGLVQMAALIRVCPYWPKPRIQCVILSFYTATTMDQSLLLLTAHLAEARGGQGPLVADTFNTACPKNNNQTLVNAEGAQSGAVNAP